MSKASIVILASLATAAVASAQSTTETFTNGTNAGAWTFGNAADTIESSGGNPGFYLHNPDMDTIAPQPRTGAGVQSAFTGNYRARRVASMEVDLRTLATQFNFSRQLSLILENDAGTPADPSDDCSVYIVTGELVPQVAEGWKHFVVPVPSQSTTLPPGWVVLGNCSGAPDAGWNSVITGVDRVRWFFGDPALFYIFDVWDAGMDNARIVEEVGSGTCFGDGSNGPCPCANFGGAGEGCANSTGAGAEIAAMGSTSVSANDLVLVATQMKPNTLSIAFQGNAVLAVPQPYGDGLRCAGGTLKRLGIGHNSPAGSASFGPGLAAAGGWTSGAIFGFQVVHRDPTGPCGRGFNVTPTVAVAFTN
jgi:hypothetical protein